MSSSPAGESFGAHAFDALAADAQATQGFRSNVEKWLGMDGEARRPRDVIAERIDEVVRVLSECERALGGRRLELGRADARFRAAPGREVLVRFRLREVELLERRHTVELRIAQVPYRFAGASVVWAVASRRWGTRFEHALQTREPLAVRSVARGAGYSLVPSDFESRGFGPACNDADVAISLAQICAYTADEVLAVQAGLAAAETTERLAPPESNLDRIEGCLLGGAIGDALGYPVEFDRGAAIAERFKSSGPAFLPAPDAPIGAVSDDTQMTLFTAEALTRLTSDEASAVRQAAHEANLAWYRTQTRSAPLDGTSGLAASSWLYARRAPGSTMIGSLAVVADEFDSGRVSDAANESKGCGTVMRSAPFGLVSRWTPAMAFDAAARAAALTHGHPTAQTAAGAFAMVIRLILDGESLTSAIRLVLDHLRVVAPETGAETTSALGAAVAAAGRGRSGQAQLASLGAGWVAEEALSIAVYAALVHPAPAEVTDALGLAVTHDGDSDSTGAICGNILGALHGVAALAPEFAARVEGADIVRAVARSLEEADTEKSRM